MPDNKTVTFDAPPVPCPFCGSTKITVADLAGWEVWCEECGASCRTADPDTQEAWATSEKAIAAWNTRAPTPAAQSEGQEAVAWPILKGIGKINGDGWKDTTKVGQIVYVWNAEKPAPYMAGQFPRIGNEGWTASTKQYDFIPATVEEIRDLFSANAAPVNGGERALDLLETLFEAYENGPACYEDPSEQAGFVGNAVRLDDETFHACADLLNLHRPRDSERAADAQQATAINAELLEALDSLLTDVGRASSLRGAVKARAALAKARGETSVNADDFVECQACYGKGFNDVERQVAERKSDVQTFRETCDACEGTGKVNAGGVA